jgi:hypothetical protein
MSTIALENHIFFLLQQGNFAEVHAILDIPLERAQEACKAFKDAGTDFLNLLQSNCGADAVAEQWQEIEKFRNKIVDALIKESNKHD